jgi:solute carrier family 25 folate transporter 32
MLTPGCIVWRFVFLQLHAATQRGCRTDELSASELVVTSAFSKMVASTITYPHEVVRSYMHVTGALTYGL